MDDEKLKKLFEKVEIPQPSNEARERAMKAAMDEFEAQKEKSPQRAKGFSWLARLMGKSKDDGGPVMNAIFMRRMSVFASLGLVLLVFAFIVGPKLMRLEKGQMYEVARLEQPEKPQRAQQPPPPEQEPMRFARNEAAPALKPQLEEKADASASLQSETGGRQSSALRDITAEPAAPPSPPPLDEFAESDYDVAVGGAASAPAEGEVRLAEEAFRAKPLAKKERRADYKGVGGTGGMMAPAPPPPVSMDNIRRQPGDEYSGRDQFEHKEVNPVKLTSEEPVSTFSVDVDTASYSFMRRAIMEGALPQKDAVRVEEMINYFDYGYEVPADRSRPFKPTVAVYPTPWNKGTRLLHIGIKGYEITADEKPRSNLVFLLDVSGSMQSADKLPLLKNSMRMLVDELSPEDTVGIVVYAGAAGTVLEPTSVKEKGKILAAIERLEAGGSTAGAEGIRQAYALAEGNFDKKAVNRVILATDGDFNVGITNREELKGFVERKRETGIYLSVLGFGRGNYNDSLMQVLAQNGNGVAAYIDTLNEARKVLVDEASSTLFPIATDVKIQVEFNPERVAEYRLIGYETRMLKREDFNNDKIDAGDIGAGHTVTAIYEIVPVGSDARLVDDLRYSSKKSAEGPVGEYAFLKMRYKLPGESTSRLITRPIAEGDEYTSVDKAPADLRFAASVAAFAQVLKGGQYTGDFSYDDIAELAVSSKGKDRFGYRAEFVNLVRLAKSARTMGDR